MRHPRLTMRFATREMDKSYSAVAAMPVSQSCAPVFIEVNLKLRSYAITLHVRTLLSRAFILTASVRGPLCTRAAPAQIQRAPARLCLLPSATGAVCY